MNVKVLEIIFGVISGIIASLLGGLLYVSLFRIKEVFSKLKKSKEITFEEILASDDLKTVGSYLDDVIGKFTVYEYASNSKVSEIIDKYLNRIQHFVGTEKSLDQQIRETEDPPKIKKQPGFTDDFQKVLDELYTGEIWNSLARLRRYIEITLRDIANERDIFVEPRSSAGKLLNILHRKEVFSGDTYSRLRYAVTISNKAVHGDEVGIKEAEEAILNASVALNGLNKLISDKTE